jgi:MFS family permease
LLIYYSQQDKERFYLLMHNSSQPSKHRLSLWHHRDYLLLWSGQAISSLGTEISQVAFPLLVLALTNSPFQAGLAGALRLLPYFLFGLPAGALVDRWDRKRVMLFCDLGRAVSLASIPLALALWHLTLLQLDLNAFIEGTLYVFFDLAEAASLPRVVSSDQLPRATAQNAFTGGLTRLIGPALGTAFYSLRSLLPFVMDAFSYLCSALSLACIKARFQQERQPVQRRSLPEEIRAGLVWLWHQPFLRLLALFTGLINFVFPDTSALIVLVLARQQGVTTAAIGLIFSIASLGYIAGSLVSEPLLRRFRLRRLIVSSCWLFALLWSFFLFSTSFSMLLVITTFLSLVDPIYDVAQFSYRAALIPDELQGRVNSAYRLLALSTPPLGYLLAGLLLQAVGARPTILVFLVCLLLLALLATWSRVLQKNGVGQNLKPNG